MMMNLSARISDKAIQVFAVGKWRNIRYYSGNGIPSKRIIAECIQTIYLQSGWQPSQVKVNLKFDR